MLWCFFFSCRIHVGLNPEITLPVVISGFIYLWDIIAMFSGVDHRLLGEQSRRRPSESDRRYPHVWYGFHLGGQPGTRDEGQDHRREQEGTVHGRNRHHGVLRGNLFRFAFVERVAERLRRSGVKCKSLG